MKNLEIAVCKMVQQDDFAHGCNPSTMQDKGEIAKYENQSIEDVANIINFFTGGRNKPTVYEDRIEVSVSETDKGEAPTPEDEDLFEQGKIKLYVADYSFYITKVERTSYTQNDLLEAFDYELS